MADRDAFTIEVIIPGTEPILGRVTAEEARAVQWNDVPPGADERKHLAVELYGYLHRMVSKGIGEFAIRGVSGRHWVIPVKSIAAIGFSDPREAENGAGFGFGTIKERPPAE